MLGRPDRSSLAVKVLPFLKKSKPVKSSATAHARITKILFLHFKISLPVLTKLTQNLMHTLCSSTSAIPQISENRRRLMQYTHKDTCTQSNASTSNHSTRHTNSQDNTATHPSGKRVNYKRLACYEHCPGTFGHTFV